MKKLNLSFCEDLVNADFFLVTNNKNSHYQKIEKVVQWNGNKLFSLDILNLYKELKQLIRLVAFLKLKKSKKGKLVISSKESEDIFLLIAYFKKYFADYNILVSELSRVGEIQKFDSSNIGLISFFSYTENLEKNLIFNKIFLISVIDLDNRIRKEVSIYKIYNKLDTFKKSLFFIALLENLLKFKD
jgi:hypothetical protein